MQQRRPRLGDVLDDYCPRERRVTNHVVVAMIEDQVKQTRCTTCDADHDYKQARVPSPRRPKPVAAIQDGAEAFEAKPVLAAPARGSADGSPDDDARRSRRRPTPHARAVPTPPRRSGARRRRADAAGRPPVRSRRAAAATRDRVEHSEDEGPVHRRLIRATLPRPEGHVPERKEPEFTIRQQGARGGGGGREVDGNQRRLPARRAAVPARRAASATAAAGIRGSAASATDSGQQPQRRAAARPNDGQRGGRARTARAAIRAASARPGSGRRRGGR